MTNIQVQENRVTFLKTWIENVSPQSFNSLIMARFAGDITSSVRPTKRMIEHVFRNIDVFRSLILRKVTHIYVLSNKKAETQLYPLPIEIRIPEFGN